jgi:predicted cupin superfamily sugar epimerase
MSQVVQGTFATGSTASVGNVSDSLLIPTGTTTMRLTVTGLDASNTVKTQKRTAPGGAFADQTTYNSNQTNVAVTVAAGEEWRLFQLAQQATRDVVYKLSAES